MYLAELEWVQTVLDGRGQNKEEWAGEITGFWISQAGEVSGGCFCRDRAKERAKLDCLLSVKIEASGEDSRHREGAHLWNQLWPGFVETWILLSRACDLGRSLPSGRFLQ